MEIRPLTPTEQKYTYAQSMQIEGQTGTIGHLRGDFATTGYGFYTTWFDTRPQWKTDEFKADLDTVINALREDKGLLHNRYDMGAFARKYPESAMQGNYCTEYGFRVDTGKHAFLFRCNPTKGDYNFYCYCYVKEWLNQHKRHASPHLFLITEKEDRILLSSYEIPNGEDKNTFSYEFMKEVEYIELKKSKKFTPALYYERNGVWEGGSTSQFSPVMIFKLWEKFSDTCLEVFESMEVNGKRTFGYDVPIIYKRV